MYSCHNTMHTNTTYRALYLNFFVRCKTEIRYYPPTKSTSTCDLTKSLPDKEVPLSEEWSILFLITLGNTASRDLGGCWTEKETLREGLNSRSFLFATKSDQFDWPMDIFWQAVIPLCPQCWMRNQKWKLYNGKLKGKCKYKHTRSIGPSGPRLLACGPSGRLWALRACLTSCDPRDGAMIG